MHAGEHSVVIEGFVRGNNGVMMLEYSGRDTGFSRALVKSVGTGGAATQSITSKAADFLMRYVFTS
jgi:hypothetical protein